MMKTRMDDNIHYWYREEGDEISYIESFIIIMLIEYWSNYIEK
jgi:hypothetical protein